MPPKPCRFRFTPGFMHFFPALYFFLFLIFLNPASALAFNNLPNLTPYKPAGWVDQVVVSNSTGDTRLTDTDILYLDWAVINSGLAPVTARFNCALYIDGVYQTFWYSDPPLNSNYYVFVEHFNLGTFTVGTHTVRIVADSTGAIAENDESDNEHTKIITVVTSDKPNLAPYAPAGWDDKIVISSKPGTTTSDSPLTTSDTLYLDWAAINNGQTATRSRFDCALYVDGVYVKYWGQDPPLHVNDYTYIQDYKLGMFAAGTHTIKLVSDSTDTISESYESDNEYLKTFTVGNHSAQSIRVDPARLAFSILTPSRKPAADSAQSLIPALKTITLPDGRSLSRLTPATGSGPISLARAITRLGGEVLQLTPEGTLLIAYDPAKSAALSQIAGISSLAPLQAPIPISQPYSAAIRATGARPPTRREKEFIDRLMTRVESVPPNALSKTRAALQGSQTSTPASVDNSVSLYFPPIGDQGNQGSCTAWAAGYYYNTFTQARDENLKVSDGNKNNINSPAFLYNLVNGGTDFGASIDYVTTRLNDLGCCSWTLKPYLASDWTSWPTESAWVEALKRRTQKSHYIDLQSDAGLTTLKQHLANGNIAVTATDVYSNWNPVLAEGRGIQNGVLFSHAGATWLGGHAMTIVGYDDNRPYYDGSTIKRGAFLIANSWGDWGLANTTGAGNHGFMWVAYDYARADNNCFDEAWYNEDRPQYRPRLYALAGLGLDRRGYASLNGGIGAPAAPAWTSQYAVDHDGGNLALSKANRIAVDLTDGIPAISDYEQIPLFVSCALDTQADANATLANSQFFYDFDATGSFSNLPSTKPVVTVTPGKAGYATVSFHANPLSKAFSIYNTGSSPLRVTSIALDAPAPAVSWKPAAPFDVPPYSSVPVMVSINGAQTPIGRTARHLLVYSNDPTAGKNPATVDITITKGSPVKNWVLYH